MNNVWVSILYLVSTSIEITFLMQLQKNKEKLEFTRWVLMTIVLLMCIDALVLGVVDLFKIPIELLTVTVVHVLASVFLYFYNTKRDKQRYYLDKLGLVAEILIIIGIIIYFSKLKDISHAPAFINSDAVVHYDNAKRLINGKHLSWMYFAPMINMVAIEFFSPWVKEFEFVKVFTLVDMVFFVYEIVFVWVVINNRLETILKKIVGIVLIFIYASQYPLSSFLYNFLYWGMAVLLISTLVVLTEDIDREEHKLELNIGWGLILFSITMCYMILGPFTIVAVIIYEVLQAIVSNNKINLKAIGKIVVIILIPTVFALFFGAYKLTGGQLSMVTGIAKAQGNIYTEYYWQFVWLLPFVVYDGVKTIQSRALKFEWLAEMVFCVSVVVLTFMVLHEWISAYYFYKMYYPLFMFSTVIAASAISQMIDERNVLFPSLIVMYLIPFVMHFCKIEESLIASDTYIQYTNHSDGYFLMWNQNEYIRKRNSPIFNDDEMSGLKYIYENFNKENVPMVGLLDEYLQCMWYDEITGQDSGGYYSLGYDSRPMIDAIDSQENGLFCVCKRSTFATENAEWLGSHRVIYENPGFVVYSK